MNSSRNIILDAEDLHKSYTLGTKVLEVLRGASLKISQGETVAIIGLSGAGKSTLLHVLGGLDTPRQGKVTIDGTDMYGASERKRTEIRARKIGFVFQAYHLFPELNVVENTVLPAMTGKGTARSTDEMKKRAMELLDTVGLSNRATHRPMELSGGEQQRLALVRALMNDPLLVLADEPTGNLDADTGGLVLDHLFKLTRENGRTLVIVTHNDALAARCDRVLRLADGILH